MMNCWQKLRLWLLGGAFANGLAGLWVIAWIGHQLPEVKGGGGLDFAALVTAIAWLVVHVGLIVWALNAKEAELEKWFGDHRRG